MNKRELLVRINKEEYEACGYTEEDVLEVLNGISYMNNDIFRFVFGSGDKKSKTILKAMTSYIVKKEVVDVTIGNCEPVKDRHGEKGVRLDLLVHALDDRGNRKVINLEMQNYGTSESNSMRLQAYMAKLISQQIKQGSSDYWFNETYQVMFCNWMNSIKDDRYYHEYRYKEEKLLPYANSAIVIVELGKLGGLNVDKIGNWSEMEKIGYMMRYSLDESKCDIIKLLEDSSEVLQFMKDKMQEFLDEMTCEIAELRAMYDKWAAEEEKEEFERWRIEYEQYKVNKIKFNADLEKFRV